MTVCSFDIQNDRGGGGVGMWHWKFESGLMIYIPVSQKEWPIHISIGLGQIWTKMSWFWLKFGKILKIYPGGGGGHWPRKGVWGCAAPEDPLFTPLLLLARVPFQAKESVHKTPFWKNFEIFSLYSLIFHPNFSSQAPKFGNFQLTSPQIWKFSTHKPPLFRGQCQFTSPTLRKSGPHTPTWKKVQVPPPPGNLPICQILHFISRLIWLTMFAACPSRAFVLISSPPQKKKWMCRKSCSDHRW